MRNLYPRSRLVKSQTTSHWHLLHKSCGVGDSLPAWHFLSPARQSRAGHRHMQTHVGWVGPQRRLHAWEPQQEGWWPFPPLGLHHLYHITKDTGTFWNENVA